MHRCALLGLVPVLFACGEKDGTSAVETTAGSTASDTASGPTTGGPATTGAAQTSSTGSSTSAGSTTSVTTVGNVASTTTTLTTTSVTGDASTTTATVVGTVGGAGGGTASGSTSVGATTGGTLAACEGNPMFCDDFEGAAAGALPNGPGWLGIDEAACGSGNFELAVSSERAFSGTQSLKITNASWAQCRIAANFGDADEFWLRANLFWENSVDFSNKEVLAIDLAPATNLTADDPAIRFGSRTKEPCTQNGGGQITIIGLGNGESTGCDGAHPLPQATWYCFEAHVTQAGGTVSVKTYIDGEGLTYSSSGKEPTETIDSTGVTAKVNHLRLGMFSTTSNLTGVVFVDDIAVAGERIGCNAM